MVSLERLIHFFLNSVASNLKKFRMPRFVDNFNSKTRSLFFRKTRVLSIVLSKSFRRKIKKLNLSDFNIFLKSLYKRNIEGKRKFYSWRELPKALSLIAYKNLFKLKNYDFDQIKTYSKDDFVKKAQSFYQNLSIQKLFVYTNFLMFLFIASQFGKFSATIVEKLFLSVPVVSSGSFTVKPQLPPSKSLKEFRSIVEYNVFGVKVKADVKNKIVDSSEIVESNSVIIKRVLDNLKLAGTLIWGEQNKFAMIEQTKKRKEETYVIGDIIFDTKAELIKIEERKVWIKIGEEVGLLKYDEEDAANIIFEKDNGNKQVKKNNAKSDSKIRTSKNKGEYDVIQTGKNNFEIPKTEIDKAMNNLSGLMMQARAVPIFKQGKFDGFKIKKISKGSLYDKLGIKNNDVVKSVNGEIIDGVEKAMSLLTLLKSERQISVQVIRNGTTENLSYEIK